MNKVILVLLYLYILISGVYYGCGLTKQGLYYIIFVFKLDSKKRREKQ